MTNIEDHPLRYGLANELPARPLLVARRAALCGVSVDQAGPRPGCLSDPPQKKSACEARIEAAVLGLLAEICGRDLPFMRCCYGIGMLAHHPVGRIGQGRSEPAGLKSCRTDAVGRADPVPASLRGTLNAIVRHQ